MPRRFHVRQRGWLYAYQSELLEHNTTYIGFVGEAHSVWNYESLFVSGLLQTEDYGRRHPWRPPEYKP
jgi:hypothetical protein